MKTLREYLNELPEPYKSDAIKEAEKADKKDGTDTLKTCRPKNIKDALSKAFVWSETEDGFVYWGELFKTL